MATYKISMRHAKLSNNSLFDVSKNDKHISTYLDPKHAIIKVYNDLTRYRDCAPEPAIKNSYRRSKNNNINFIG